MNDPQATHAWAFEAIGTSWWIGIYERLSSANLSALQEQISARIEAYDVTYSRFRSDSLVTQMSKQAGSYHLPADSKPLFHVYQSLYDATDGAVTPLIGQAIADTGYDAAYSFRTGRPTQPPSWDEAMTFQDRTLTVHTPVLLDFGAAGKGQMVDIIADILDEQGVHSFCIDAGGDMVCRGLAKGLSVGLEHPFDYSQVIGAVQIKNGALCGSSGNRRAWQGYTHILNPRTLASPSAIFAVWCMAADCMTADGLATALFFVEPERLSRTFNFDYCIVYADESTRYSAAFADALFTAPAMAPGNSYEKVKKVLL